MSKNYKNYQAGDIIAFRFASAVKEGKIECMDDDGFSVLLTKDSSPWHVGDRFIIQWNDHKYKESIKIKATPFPVTEKVVEKEVKIPWYKKLFNIYD